MTAPLGESQPAEPQQDHPIIERMIEHVLFASRWIMAPFYLGLIVALLLLLAEFVQRTYELAAHFVDVDRNEIILGTLALIDLSLMGNLVLMVMFAGYENFISKMDIVGHKDRPDWMGHVGFGDLKLKLMTSIVAISAIHVLESFMNVAELSNRELAWTISIHLTFIISGVLLAIMDRLMRR